MKPIMVQCGDRQTRGTIEIQMTEFGVKDNNAQKTD